MSASGIKVSLTSLGIAPADAQFQSEKTPGVCAILFYKSASIASDPGANDTAGTFIVDLENPVSVPGWDPTNVTGLIYDLDESGGC